MWFLSPFYSTRRGGQHPPAPNALQKLSTCVDTSHGTTRRTPATVDPSAEAPGPHGVADPLPLRGGADHRLPRLAEPQPDAGRASVDVCRERAEVGRPAVRDVPGFRDGDSGRVEPEGLDERPLHRPGDQPVAVDEGPEGGDLGVHQSG